MNKHLKIAIFSSTMLIFSAQAYASDPYVGLGFGVYNLGSGVTKKATSGAYLQLGDNFSEYLGGEIRIGRTGQTGEEFTAQPRMRMDSFVAAYLKPKYEFNSDWMGYALLGIARVSASYSEPGLAKQTKSRTGYAYGLGTQYNINDSYSITGEFSHMLSKPKTNATAIKTAFRGLEASSLALSVQYHF